MEYGPLKLSPGQEVKVKGRILSGLGTGKISSKEPYRDGHYQIEWNGKRQWVKPEHLEVVSMNQTVKQQIIATLLNAQRPDLANAVAKTKVGIELLAKWV